MNIIDILMGKSPQEKYEQECREERQRIDAWNCQQIKRAPARIVHIVKNQQSTVAVGNWWSGNNPNTLAKSLHKLRDAMDMKRLTPDLDW